MSKGVRATLNVLLAAVVATGCQPSQPSADYLAICEGPPLKTLAQREKAMDDGYEIDRNHDCITKRSAKMMAEQRALIEAANTPEAKAARQAELERRAEEARVDREMRAKADAEARAEREQRLAAAEQVPIKAIEINHATEVQLASVDWLGADVARQIVAEQAKGRFANWGDVIRRVPGLSAAESAVRASAFGLTVNGRSLEGAEPDSLLARAMRERWRRRGG